MTILYDASILGYSLLRKEYRTGIFRVAVAQIRALARRPGVRVVLYPGAGNQLLVQHALKRLGLVGIQTVGSRLWGTVAFLVLMGRNLAYRKGYKPLSLALSRLHAAVSRTRTRADRPWLDQAQWYLSPMEAAPVELRSIATLGLAYVLHDLIPLIVSDYKQDSEDPTRWFPRLMKELRHSDLIFTVSEFTKSDFLRLRPDWPSEQLLVAPNAFDSERFVPTVAPVEEPAYFLTVSTVEPRKRIDTILAGFVAYRQAGGTARLVVCGANRGNHLAQVLASLPSAILDHVTFTGYVADDELPRLYQGCLAFLYLSDYEGFGLPVLEAMACGAPVVVSTRTSLPEVAGPAGIYVESGDALAVSRQLHRLETDRAWRQERRMASQKQAGLFRWDETANLMCASLEQRRVARPVGGRTQGRAQ